MTEQVGLREVRQHASELVRRVEAGEEIVVTVAGRPAARLVPIRPMRWRKGSEIQEILSIPVDPSWATEHAHRSHDFDDAPRDPWDVES